VEISKEDRDKKELRRSSILITPGPPDQRSRAGETRGKKKEKGTGFGICFCSANAENKNYDKTPNANFDKNENITMKHIILILMVLSFNATLTFSQVIERKRPAGWENLVFGGRFIDRFMYLPDLGGMTSDTWGADSVVPRDINNGIEDPAWSYWGGNIRLLSDGKYHLFVCRWPENSPKGHMEWPRSQVVQAVSDNRFGPYKVVEEIGRGHNPEWYITDNGKFVIYVIGRYYISDNINGPWKQKRFDFDRRDRRVKDGLSNLSFAKREDGSFVMVSRGGGIWISKDGISTWYRVSDGSVYPPVDGRFEDPVIWKTDVQYHLIVNDWYGRIAWYLRSKDGIHWKTDAGEAYMPGIAKYKNGIKEDWFKYERIKILQDEYGRAIQANFAVIDTLKHEDKHNDNHSSKNIVIPLKKGQLISVLNKEPLTKDTRSIKLRIKSEPGFDPYADLDFELLKFGAPEVVDFGKGCKVADVKKEGSDVIVTFDGDGNGFTEDNFAGKLLGRDKKGGLIFGYSRLPGVKYIEPVLSARKPVPVNSGNEVKVKIENFGQMASGKAEVSIWLVSGEKRNEIAKGDLSPLQPFEGKEIILKTYSSISCTEGYEFVVYINKGKKDEVKNTFDD